MKTVIVDTTIISKAIAHLIGSRLLEHSRKHLIKATNECELKLRQNYTEKWCPVWPFKLATHARQLKRMNKTLRTSRSRVGMDSSATPEGQEHAIRFDTLEVECINKDKACAPYAFGIRMSNHNTRGGLCVEDAYYARHANTAFRPAPEHDQKPEDNDRYMKSDGKLAKNWFKSRLGDVPARGRLQYPSIATPAAAFYTYVLILMVRVSAINHNMAPRDNHASFLRNKFVQSRLINTNQVCWHVTAPVAQIF